MWLTVGSKGGDHTSVLVEGERFVVGSDPECQLQIADDSVAPLHLFFGTREDGVVEVHDLGSENGTLVNGERLDGSMVIRGGEEIRLGDAVILASADAPPEPVLAAAEQPPVAIHVDTPDPGAQAVATVERRRLWRSLRRTSQ